MLPTLLLALLAAAPGPTPRPFVAPAGWTAPALPPDNQLTQEGVELGRLLFADRRLSARHRQNCLNCHRESLAFADGGAFSTGADGIQGTRSSPPIFNQAWHPAFSWDGKQPRLRDQAKAAITNPAKMHADPATVEADLRRDEKMRARFAAAFGTPEITLDRVGLALGQFMLTYPAAGSRFGTLARVVAHYAGGVRPSPTLDPVLATQPAGGITLSDDDQRALVALLKTLTETRLKQPARWAEPTGSPRSLPPRRSDRRKAGCCRNAGRRNPDAAGCRKPPCRRA